jgi:DNA mismatch endonuclease Vsr
MSRVWSTGSEIERILEKALLREDLTPIKHAPIFGRPDFVFTRARVAIFCDSHFWHGYRWRLKKRELRRNRSFWLKKISGNIRRDRLVNRTLRQDGWTVLRFWEHQILRFPERCAARVKEALAAEQKT